MDFSKLPRLIFRFLHSLVVLALVALILPAALLTALGLVQDTPAPVLGTFRALTVQDDAMAPTLEKGDLVLLRVREGGYETGDTVAASAEGGYTFGRIMIQSGDKVNLGNAAASAVRMTGVPADKLLGSLMVAVPGYGAALDWAMTGFGMFTLLCAGVLTAELPRFITDPPEDDEEDEEEDEEE